MACLLLCCEHKKAHGCSRPWALGCPPSCRNRIQVQANDKSGGTIQDCHKPQPKSSRVFVVAPYLPDSKQRLIPNCPTVGPCAGRDGRPCRVCLDHERARTTGPCFPLTVLRCRIHEIAFTVYPPGHVPYGRVALAPVAPDGTVLITADGGSNRFEHTLFGAALDAAEHQAWPHSAEDGYLIPRFPTQLRRLVRACRLLGVEPALEAEARQCLGSILGVAGQHLHDGAVQIQQQLGYHNRGKAVVGVLEAVRWTGMALFDRLAACGAQAGLWPGPQRWDPVSGCLQCAFAERIARAPPVP